MGTGRAPDRNGGDISPQMHNDSDDDDMIFISNDGTVQAEYSQSIAAAVASLEERVSFHSNTKTDSETTKESEKEVASPSSSGSIPSVTPPAAARDKASTAPPHIAITIHEEVKRDPELPSPRIQEANRKAVQELTNRSGRSSLVVSTGYQDVSDVAPDSAKGSAGYFFCCPCDCLKNFSLFKKEKADDTEMRAVKNKPTPLHVMSI